MTKSQLSLHHNISREHAKSMIFTGVVSIFTLALCLGLSITYEQYLKRDARQQIKSEMTPYASSLTRALNEHLSLLAGLKVFIETNMLNATQNDHFNKFASGLYSGQECIKAIQVFPPQGPVHIYPQAGNEALSGRTLQDLTSTPHPAPRYELLRTVDPIDGKFNLTARQPIFHEEKFWGLAEIIFNLTPILSLASLDPLPQNINLALKDENGRIIIGNPAIFDSDPAISEVTLPGSSWQLGAVPPGGWAKAYSTNLYIFKFAGLLVSTLVIALAYATSNQRLRLTSLVDKQTRKLLEHEENLLFQHQIISINNHIANIFLTSPAEKIYTDVLHVIMLALNSQYGHFGYIDDEGDLIYPPERGTLSLDNHAPHDCWIDLKGSCLDTDPDNSLTVPIMHRTRLLGQFGVANKPGGYTPRDREMLELVALQTAPALNSLQNEIRQKKQHAELEKQYRQLQKIEAVGRLSGGIAHYFNNMLAVILGSAELALNQITPDQPLHRDLQRMEHAAQRLADITSQLLAFARRQAASPQFIDLNSTIDNMLEIIQRIIGQDIEISWLPGNDLWPIRIDPAQVGRILTNLCINSGNSIDGAGRITITTQNVSIAYSAEHVEPPPGEYINLTVSDNGAGMSQETLEHIFEPFFTTSDSATGLGLTTLYGIIKQNGGYINVESHPKQGSTFKIFIPRHTPRVMKSPAKTHINTAIQQ